MMCLRITHTTVYSNKLCLSRDKVTAGMRCEVMRSCVILGLPASWYDSMTIFNHTELTFQFRKTRTRIVRIPKYIVFIHSQKKILPYEM